MIALCTHDVTLEGRDRAFKVKPNDTAFKVEFSVNKVGPNKFELYCLHGDWSVLVDKHGIACDDIHFKDGTLMVNYVNR